MAPLSRRELRIVLGTALVVCAVLVTVAYCTPPVENPAPLESEVVR